MVHLPTVVFGPMPEQRILALGVPIPFDGCPEIGNAHGKRFFLIVSVCVERSGREKPLREESRVHRVASVIVFAEAEGFACFGIVPMRPGTVKTFCRFKEGY